MIEKLPFSELKKGPVKILPLTTRTVTLQQSATQIDVDLLIPAQGDLLGLLVEYTVNVTGTLSAQLSLDRVFNNISARDVENKDFITSLRGDDIYRFHERFNCVGRTRTIATVSNTAQTDYSYLPLSVSRNKLPGYITMTLEAAATLATGGTGGSVTYRVYPVYAEDSVVDFTQRIRVITSAIASGANNLLPILPRGSVVQRMYAGFGTESNFTDFTIQRDGGAELNTVPRGTLIGLNNALLSGGHLTGTFSFYVTPFEVKDTTVFSITGGGSESPRFTIVTVENDAKAQA